MEGIAAVVYKQNGGCEILSSKILKPYTSTTSKLSCK